MRWMTVMLIGSLSSLVFVYQNCGSDTSEVLSSLASSTVKETCYPERQCPKFKFTMIGGTEEENFSRVCLHDLPTINGKSEGIQYSQGCEKERDTDNCAHCARGHFHTAGFHVPQSTSKTGVDQHISVEFMATREKWNYTNESQPADLENKISKKTKKANKSKGVANISPDHH